MKKFKIIIPFLLLLFSVAFLNDESGVYEHIYANKQFKYGYKYYSYGQYDKALEYFEKAHNFNREDTAFIYWISKANYELYNFDAADTYISMIADRDANSELANNLIKKLTYFSNVKKTKYVSLELLNDTLVFRGIKSRYPEFELKRPTSIIIGEADRKYVLSSYNNVIFILNVNNNLERVITLGHKIKSAYDFVLVSGRFYVTDFEGDYVYVYEKNGKFVKRFGGPGRENGKFYGPKGIFYYKGFLYIVDTGNNRIQRFDIDGNLFDIYMIDYKEPIDVVALDDKLYVSCDDINNIRKGYFVEVDIFTGENKLLKEMEPPRGMFVFENNILISTYFGEKIYVYDAAGKRFKQIKGFPRFVESLAFDGNNLFAIDYTEDLLLVRYNKQARYMLNCDIKEVYFNNLPLIVLRVRFMDNNFKPIENITKQNISLWENEQLVSRFDIEPDDYDKFYYTFIISSKKKELLEQLNFIITHLKKSMWRVMSCNADGAVFLNSDKFDDKPNLIMEAVMNYKDYRGLDIAEALRHAVVPDNKFMGHSVVVIIDDDIKLPEAIDEIRQLYNFYNTPVYVLALKKNVAELKYLADMTDGEYYEFAAGEYVLIKNRKRHYYYLISFKSQFYELRNLDWSWIKLEIDYKGGNGMDIGGVLLAD